MPLAYIGMGDLFVFLFFGLAAVCGTCFVQIHHVPAAAWVAGAAIGLLATAILVVNNLRDRETDAIANKRTLAVRFGARTARIEHMLCIGCAYGLIIAASGLGWAPTGWLLALLTLPLAIQEIRGVRRQDGPALNPHLAGAARLELLFGLALCIGAWL